MSQRLAKDVNEVEEAELERLEGRRPAARGRGGGGSSDVAGGNGGSGVVIVRYQL